MEAKIYDNIPKEKFQFAKKEGFGHDEKLSTKPRSYMRDAFSRFCKNKGSVVAAVIILFMLLFAIIVPFCTPYTVAYEDTLFAYALPKNPMFEKTSFWDGCSKKEQGAADFNYYYFMGEETGHYAIKNQKYKYDEKSKLYTYRLDSYQMKGCYFRQISAEEYENIQKYQDETGIQVLYPTIKLTDRAPESQVGSDRQANIYYKHALSGTQVKPVLDANGNVQPIYWQDKGENLADNYHSKRIEGENGFKVGNDTYYYVYARGVAGGDVEVRLNNYEYYVYNHTYVLKDGIKKPMFLFGSTHVGKDILVCLASGARFSFIFAISVSLVNMFLGAIYGAIEGYYGGKIDLILERISDILAAVPSMIVITLLKYHLGASLSPVLILFIAFVATGWIGMAGSTRMQFYRYKNQEYVLAARTLGAKDRRLMWKHIFPNSLGTLITGSALVIPAMIFSETSLSYLGIINLSTGNITSVGTLIAAGQPYMVNFPHMVAFPSVFLALLMLCFNLFGNGLRDAFNPSLRGSEG